MSQNSSNLAYHPGAAVSEPTDWWTVQEGTLRYHFKLEKPAIDPASHAPPDHRARPVYTLMKRGNASLQWHCTACTKNQGQVGPNDFIVISTQHSVDWAMRVKPGKVSSRDPKFYPCHMKAAGSYVQHGIDNWIEVRCSNITQPRSPEEPSRSSGSGNRIELSAVQGVEGEPGETIPQPFAWNPASPVYLQPPSFTHVSQSEQQYWLGDSDASGFDFNSAAVQQQPYRARLTDLQGSFMAPSGLDETRADPYSSMPGQPMMPVVSVGDQGHATMQPASGAWGSSSEDQIRYLLSSPHQAGISQGPYLTRSTDDPTYVDHKTLSSWDTFE